MRSHHSVRAEGLYGVARLEREGMVRPMPPFDQPGAPWEPKRIVVIDDNVDGAESLKDVLEAGGHDVRVAFDGPEGLAELRSFVPDVVLCDIGLPGMDGYDVARAVRADPTLASAFLVALSGYAAAEDVERAKRAGFDRHMAKPPDLSALDRLLATVPSARSTRP